MENEENKGLNDKKASEDQFVTFFQFSFGALSFSHTLGHLDFSWRILGGVWHTWIFGARRKRKR